MSVIIGLTGSIATGKSTISNMFKEILIPVIDADLLARKVCEKGESAYLKIVSHFGNDILEPNGELNRKKLGSIVFKDETKISLLNSIIHPEVKKLTIKYINEYKTKGESFIVLDVPLLFESHFDDLCDVTLVVYTDIKTQINRLMNRDHLSYEEALLRIHAQMDLKKKIELSNYQINNSNSLEETKRQFNEFVNKMNEMI